MSLRRLRAGELLAAAGAALVIVSLLEPWYEGPGGKLDAWDTFGPAMLLVLAATAAAIALTLSTVAERSVALPVATGVWSVLLGLLAVIAAAVRLLESPQHATAVCVGAWLAQAHVRPVLKNIEHTFKEALRTGPAESQGQGSEA